MARMLFLRDIDVDVHIRCRGCGHQGVLPRDILDRRFGPNYPVLSIAPHFRCSRCDSRDTESTPALATAIPPPATPTFAEPALDGPLAALQGLLAAAQARRESDDDSGGGDDRDVERGADGRPAPSRTGWPDDDWRDEGGKAQKTRDVAADTDDADDDADDGADDGSFAHVVADADDAPVTRAAADEDFLSLERLAEEDPTGAVGRRPLWEPMSLAEMAARLEDDEDSGPDPQDVLVSEDEKTEATDAEDEDDPLALSDPMAALRALLAGAGHGDADDSAEDGAEDGGDEEEIEEEIDEEEEAEPPVFSTRALVRTDRPADEDPDEEDEPSDDEPSDDDILAFAIRDPEKPVPPWDRPRPRTAEPLDETLAALRNMVREAAADRDGGDRGDRPDDHHADEEDARDGGDFAADPWPVDEAADAESEADKEPPRSRKSAQEQEMEQALLALRDLVEEDDTELVQPEPVAFRPLAQGRGGRAGRGAQRPPVDFVDVEPMELVDEAPDDDEPDWEPPPQQPPAQQPPAAKPRAAKTPAAKTPAAKMPAEEEPPARTRTKGKPAAAAEPSAFDKTIAALRNMLELDGKRDH